MAIRLSIFFGTVSDGLSAELTGEDGALRKCPVDIFSEWASMRRESQGAATGLAVSALNHVAHRVSGPLSRLQGDPEPWDLNGDGILQKVEADLWGVKEGTDITVDNSKIDWTGLEIPEGYKDGQEFAISTTKAFIKLPYETAATYGGTRFKIISVEKGIVEVQDQSYHYEMRPNNNVENVLRNIATKIGYPTTMELYNGRFQPYMIRYNNPSIKLK